MTGLERLRAWLHHRDLGQVQVVSAHLDDAGFSLATLLSSPALPPRRVVTVFTAAHAGSDDRHARAMGFASAMEEYAARRREDVGAMAHLGVPFVHAGAVPGAFTPAAAAEVAQLLVEGQAAAGQAPGQGLVLLPAGAGLLRGAPWRLLRRLLRKPPGCGAHGEHEWVRDGLRGPLALAGLTVGYYAELPYLWSDSPAGVAHRLEALTGRSLDRLAIEPDVHRKLEVARAYASQFEGEFGTSPAFQRRSLSIPEWLFLPAQDR